MKHLSIDIETCSSESLAKTGLYKYVQSQDFEVLLVAYSVDDAPVEIIDLAQGDLFPEWLQKALFDSEYVKHAYNAAFEWYCLSKFMGRLLPSGQWRDTMLHGLYCGYPAGLDAIGKAIGLPADKQKISAGKNLVKFFCSPCISMRANGGRRRNFPEHDLEKWNLFKEYCKGDVVTEMEIERRLSSFPVPDNVEKQWQTDLIINSRGVAVDMELVQGAMEIDAIVRNKLMTEAVAITGLLNPNSPSQLAKWVEKTTGIEMPNLRKDTVEQMLNNGAVSGPVKRMLEIRQEMSRTSTKKYSAIEEAVCADGRVRGLLQFYGANRTGRWAGRNVQVHNLPRSKMDVGDISVARNMVKGREFDKLRGLSSSVTDTLSQLIRTSFVSTSGNKLVDADFSSIEARVITWLANENWALNVFRTHGKIYEANASLMFGVPIDKIVKGNPEYELRQRGKVATLALGYQGGIGALIAMGALSMGIPMTDLHYIVDRWRDTNKCIVALWRELENAAVSVIQNGGQVRVNGLLLSREIDIQNDLDFLTITLPSQRKLYYAKPALRVNSWGKPSIKYMGIDQVTKKWEYRETYGGKLVENVVQAIARDCLAVVIEKLEAAGFPIVFHVHDEVVIDCAEEKANLDEVVRIMTEPIPWAQGLPLNADGWVDDFFRKD